MSSLRKRSLSAAAVASGLLVLTATGASAHVSVTPTVTTAGAYSVLTFAVPHGCDGSPTTKISIQVPDDFATVTPGVNPNWTVEKVMAKLDKPVADGHGGQYTERVSEVVYTAKTPLADGYRDTLDVQVKLPDAVGKTLVFPIVQTCEKGETAWVQIPAAGQEKDDLKVPAPAVTITAPIKSDGEAAVVGKTVDAPVSAKAVSTPTAAPVSTASTSPVAWTGLVLGAAGFVLGGVALARTRKTA